MKRENDLKKLLGELKKDIEVKDEYKYIGTGNPLAEILIIGKEVSISKDDSDQYKQEIEGNFNFWLNTDNHNVNNINQGYNPLYPYRGQELKLDNKKGNWGTSKTWMMYQKLYNLIYNTPDNNQINFHEKFFITEVNSTPSQKTAYANKDSISYRKAKIFESDFIKGFPIVIISGVGYFETQINNEIEKIFDVKFTAKCNPENQPKQPYWVHKSEDNQKILINTYQLSMNISNELLTVISEEIKKSGLL